MFAVGDRVIVTHVEGKHATVVLDNGGGDYLVEFDEIDPATGQKARFGTPGRFLRRIDAPKPPVAGMITKGSEVGSDNGGAATGREMKGGKTNPPLRVGLGTSDEDDEVDADASNGSAPPASDIEPAKAGDGSADESST